MSEALEKKEETILDKVNLATQENILSMINSGEIETADDITYHFPSVSIDDAVALLNNEDFYLKICNHTSARVKLLYHTKGINALDKALTHGSHSDALGAYDRLAKVVNPTEKNKRPINVGIFSLEEVLDSSREKIVKGKVVKPKEEEEEFKPGLKKKSNYIPRSKVSGNIFEAGEAEEETETVYIDEGDTDEEEEWEE